MTESAAPAVTDRPGTRRWDDYLEIFIHPSAVFRRREGTNPFPPLLMLTLVTAILFFATSAALEPVFEAEMERGLARMAENPQVTPEQLEGARSFGRTMSMVMIPVTTFIIPLLVGVVLWLVAKGAGSVATLGNAIVVAVFAYFPRVLDWVVAAVLALVTPEEQIRGRFDVTLGLGRFLDPATASPLALAFLGRIDLFTIWVTVLLAIGIRIVGRISTAQAAIVAGLVWLVGALPALFGAMGQG